MGVLAWQRPQTVTEPPWLHGLLDADASEGGPGDRVCGTGPLPIHFITPPAHPCLSVCLPAAASLCVSVSLSVSLPPPPTPESLPGLREAQRRTQETGLLYEGWTHTGGGYGGTTTSSLASDLPGDVR